MTHGHMIGDKILSIIAKRIKACIRANDTAYRFAGDEFTVILPETTSEEAKFVAHRIIVDFSRDPIVVNEKELAEVTLSIGIAEYRINEGTDQFVHRADVLMYEAKGRGGNNVVITPILNDLSTSVIPRNP